MLAASRVQEFVDDDKAPPSPPVTPLELVSSELPVVAQIINSRRGQLTRKFDEATLHNIVAEFDELRREYDVSNTFRQAVKESDKPLATFDDMWVVGDAACKFPSLAEFCGGFAWATSQVIDKFYKKPQIDIGTADRFQECISQLEMGSACRILFMLVSVSSTFATPFQGQIKRSQN
ncbi:unnamed protein product [Phytophthora fragariaefolia]|uniref:Unnamed protein product n=1 Tax=Phytophthora fragariaefolia TaxID=1490495 RepID=A0A9W6TYN1_9STRA|nr:unnamed protein product [Phytophthora fragariaefolia]